jgi:hypothetical protein
MQVCLRSEQELMMRTVVFAIVAVILRCFLPISSCQKSRKERW